MAPRQDGSGAGWGGATRVCVVSLNPAVDAEWRVPSVVPEEKNELTSERRWPGGKGINVARWLQWHGVDAHLVLPLGGATGRELAVGLAAEQLAFTAVPIAQPSRVNVVVTPTVGPQLRFNPTWPVLSASEVRRSMGTIEKAWAGRGLVVFSGSLVRGAPVDTYARLIRRARQAGLGTVLDCDGEAFRKGVEAGPLLVKPNEVELAAWARRPLSTDAAFADAARELSRATGGWVLASWGARGAWLVNVSLGQELHAEAHHVRKVRNTVGAGDALLAGAVATLARSPRPDRWLSIGLRTAAAAVGRAPGLLPTKRPSR